MMKTENSVRSTKFYAFLASFFMILFAASSCQKDNTVTPNATTSTSASASTSTFKSTASFDFASYIRPNKINATITAGTTLFASAKQSAPIYLYGQNNITISDLTINGGNASCIKLTNCSNVYITRCRLGNSSLLGVELFNCKHVVIENNYIYNVASGVIAYSCPEGGIMVFSNQMKNMQGPFPRGAFVQFANVSGANNAIGWNTCQNVLGQSYPEDAIDLYQSYGTSSSPIMVQGNWIRGGGPSSTGGGINMGEQGGAYQIAQDNLVVNPGQYGMCISGGNNIKIINNSIYSKKQYFSNVGLYAWDQSGQGQYSNTVTNNQVNFTSANWGENDKFVGANTPTPAGWNSNYWGAPLNDSLLPATLVGN